MKKGKFVTSRKQPTEDPVCLEKAKIDTVYRILTVTSDKYLTTYANVYRNKTYVFLGSVNSKEAEIIVFFYFLWSIKILFFD